jgi:hypothetical protein
MEKRKTAYVEKHFNDTVLDLAAEDGIVILLSIPGIFELISEYYNNNAISRCEEEFEQIEDSGKIT